MVGPPPVLADCERLDDWNLSATTINAKVTALTLDWWRWAEGHDEVEFVRETEG